MRHVVVSFSNNQINISSVDKRGFSSISADVSQEIMNGTEIQDQNALSGVIKELLPKMGVSQRGVSLVFGVESADATLRFVTVPKHSDNVDEQILAEVKSKFPEIDLTNVYYGYEKIAPFVYQFVSVEKSYMESLLHVAETLGMTLEAIVPWVSVLPKYVNSKEPCIFIVGEGDHETVALSELGGVFFSDRYMPDGKKFDLEKTVKDLSAYKRERPIKNIYTLNYKVPELDNGYIVKNMEFNLGTGTDTNGFERNLLIHFVMDAGSDLDECRVNLLNLLPLPAVSRRPLAITRVGVMAGVGVAVAVFVLVLNGVIGQKGNSSENLADSGAQGGTNVLSTQDPPQVSPSPEPTKPAPELKRSDLTIKVENGSGVNGMAAKTKTTLEGLSYKVSEIGTAGEITTKTILRFKKDKRDYEKLLKEDLKDGFGEILVEDTLAASATEDLLLVIGSGVKQ